MKVLVTFLVTVAKYLTTVTSGRKGFFLAPRLRIAHPGGYWVDVGAALAVTAGAGAAVQGRS